METILDYFAYKRGAGFASVLTAFRSGLGFFLYPEAVAMPKECFDRPKPDRLALFASPFS
jgi:hypothetical protein